MKNLKNSAITDINIISVVIPSINGKWAKLLILEEEDYKKIKKTAESNIGKGEKIYSLFMNTSTHHALLNTGMGCLTKTQFDELLKENYNSKMQKGKGGKELKTIK